MVNQPVREADLLPPTSVEGKEVVEIYFTPERKLEIKPYFYSKMQITAYATYCLHISVCPLTLHRVYKQDESL